MQARKVYRVTVGNTNTMKDSVMMKNEEYFDCVKGEIYVITNYPEKIFERFEVLTLTLVGVGYSEGDSSIAEVKL